MNNKNDKVSVNPDKGCDIIMKGGITSGIVYPKAIFELAKSYRFRSIGGTSAGAIASGLTAAAEYRRNNGGAEGFESLMKLPDDLGKKVNGETRLLSLFAPNDKTKKYYNTLLPFLNEKGKCKKIMYGLWAVMKSYPCVMIGLIVLFGINEYLIASAGGWGIGILSSVLSLVSLLLIVVVLNSFLFLKKMNRDIKGNNFGLTKGFFSDKEKVKNKAVPLTEWLAGLIDETAGKEEGEPLTFGDLQSFDKDRNINLRMVTTNLSYGIPNTIPFKDSKSLYYFDEVDFREYFPKRVVDRMIKGFKEEDKKEGKYPFPEDENLPVIVGVRMSLSFPVLISAVPLYVMNFKDMKLTKCWFSDGGICSNFPVHFFDSPLPTRPTFAINLKQMEKANADEKMNISMAKDNKGGLDFEWNNTDGSLMGFIGSITKTMQNWNDNTQLRVPGFRDRICNILLTKDEGGLNLNMDSDFIKKISERGMFAGEELTKRFYGNESDMNWDNHKWIRLRTTLPLLQKYLKDIQKVYDEYPYEDEMGYKELIDREKDDKPASYKLDSNEQRDFIDDELEKIFAIVREWDMGEESVTFGGRNVPRPQPELRIKPKM